MEEEGCYERKGSCLINKRERGSGRGEEREARGESMVSQCIGCAANILHGVPSTSQTLQHFTHGIMLSRIRTTTFNCQNSVHTVCCKRECVQFFWF